MRVWVVNIVESLPIDGEFVRLGRAGLLARYLAARGHRVTWWASAFNHQKKRMRPNSITEIEVEPNLQIRLVPTIGYRRNVSLARILDHRFLANGMSRLWRKSERPDIVFASYPAIDTAYAAVKYARREEIPVILDINDRWPDTFVDMMPRPLRGLTRLAAAPMKRVASWTMRHASVITANGPRVIDWARRRSGRPESSADSFFPMSYPSHTPDRRSLLRASRFWARMGVSADDFIIAFVGTIGRHFNFLPVIEAARVVLRHGHRTIKFVMCGDGEVRAALMEATRDLPNILYP